MPNYLEIQRSQVALLQEIGRGSQGKTFLARFQGGFACAKVFHQANDMIREVSMLDAAKESNCAPTLLGTCKSSQLVLMDVVPGITLQEYLRSNPCRIKVHKIMTSLAQTIEDLHQIGIVHNDLKFDNIMVSGVEKLKLIDFAWATSTSSSPYPHINPDSMKFFPHISPRLANGGVCDYASDNYSFGFLLCTIASFFKCQQFNYLAKILTNANGTLMNLQNIIQYTKNMQCQHCRLTCSCDECIAKRRS